MYRITNNKLPGHKWDHNMLHISCYFTPSGELNLPDPHIYSRPIYDVIPFYSKEAVLFKDHHSSAKTLCRPPHITSAFSSHLNLLGYRSTGDMGRTIIY